MNISSFWILCLTGLFVGILVSVITQIKEEFELKNDPKLSELRYILEPMFKNEQYTGGILDGLNSKNILDSISLYKGDKSYTINKQKIFLCLTDEKGEYYNMNMLIFVTLHEIAHCLCDEIGHTNKFNDIFNELLEKAIKMKIYNPNIPILQDYCTYND
jgi:hypothetical protein